jgi:hypothetical protein
MNKVFNPALIPFLFLLIHNHALGQVLTDTTNYEEKQHNNLLLADSNYQKTVKSKINWNNLPYFFDDLLVSAGINRSGLYYSPNYLELSHLTGFQVGIENYYPILDKAFIHYGVIFSMRGFAHTPWNNNFRTTNIDVPIYLAYELPALRHYDLRLLLGIQVTRLLSAKSSTNYPTGIENNYLYDSNRFSKTDFGFTAGLSMEHYNHYFRVRMYNGYVKLMQDDQGMNSGFFFDYGYFIFRGLRK